VAPVEEFHFNVKVVGWLTAPLDGEASVGVEGAATIVVKFHTVDHSLAPPAFFAFTRQ